VLQRRNGTKAGRAESPRSEDGGTRALCAHQRPGDAGHLRQRQGRRLFRRLWHRDRPYQRRCGDARAGAGARDCRSPRSRRRARTSTGRSRASFAISLAAACWNTGSFRRAAESRSQSSRRCRITGHKSPSSAIPTPSCCRALLCCAGAEVSWCWNRRARRRLFRIADPALAATIATLVTPHKIGALRKERNFAGLALLGLLVACDILFKVGGKDEGLRESEGDEKPRDVGLPRSSCSTPAPPRAGMRRRWVDVIPTSTPFRHRRRAGAMAGDADRSAGANTSAGSARLTASGVAAGTGFGARFDDAKPVTLSELARFLQQTAHVKSKWSNPLDFGEGPLGPVLDYTARPYPAAGSAYELENLPHREPLRGARTRLLHYDADRPFWCRSQRALMTSRCSSRRRALRWTQ